MRWHRSHEPHPNTDTDKVDGTSHTNAQLGYFGDSVSHPIIHYSYIVYNSNRF